MLFGCVTEAIFELAAGSAAELVHAADSAAELVLALLVFLLVILLFFLHCTMKTTYTNFLQVLLLFSASKKTNYYFMVI